MHKVQSTIISISFFVIIGGIFFWSGDHSYPFKEKMCFAENGVTWRYENDRVSIGRAEESQLTLLPGAIESGKNSKLLLVRSAEIEAFSKVLSQYIPDYVVWGDRGFDLYLLKIYGSRLVVPSGDGVAAFQFQTVSCSDDDLKTI